MLEYSFNQNSSVSVLQSVVALEKVQDVPELISIVEKAVVNDGERRVHVSEISVQPQVLYTGSSSWMTNPPCV